MTGAISTSTRQSAYCKKKYPFNADKMYSINVTVMQIISRISKGRNDAIFLANSVAINVPRPNLYFLLNRSRQETFK